MISSPWRIDTSVRVLCDWSVDADDTSFGAAALADIVGATVEAVTLGDPGLDLGIHLSGDRRLTILCCARGETDDCWYMQRPDDSIVVASRRFQLALVPPTEKR
jgi:hypothetical protein